jgi:WD40 repeat protein
MVWHVRKGELVCTLRGHTEGQLIIRSSSCSNQTRIYVAQTRTGGCFVVGRVAVVNCCQVDAVKVVSGSADATVRVWMLTTGACVHVLTGHTSEVVSDVLTSQHNDTLLKLLSTEMNIWMCTAQFV